MAEIVSTIPFARQEKRMVFSICLSAVVLPMTFTGGAIATPDLGQDFGRSGPMLFWVVNAFMMVFGALPLVAGALADRIGRRKVFRFGLVGFLISGLALTLSPSLVFIDVLRGFQGLFAAATLAGGTAVLAQMPDEKSRRGAFSMIGATFGFGLAFGPLLAGVALEAGGWRIVFVLTSILAAAALGMGAGAIQESRTPQETAFDTWGAAFFAGGLICVTTWAVMLPTSGYSDPVEIALFIATIASLTAFVLREKRYAAPMFDLSLLKRPAFLGIQALPVATCFGFVSLLVIVPLQLIASGYSEGVAGLVSMALSAPVFLVGAALARFPHGNRRLLITFGLVLSVIGLIWLAFVPFSGPVLPLTLPLALIGFGIGFPWGLMDGLAIEVVPREKAGVATGMFATVRVASEGLVLALVSAAYAWLIMHFSGVSDQDAAAIVSGGAIGPDMRMAVNEACCVLFVLLAALTLLAAVFAWNNLKFEE